MLELTAAKEDALRSSCDRVGGTVCEKEELELCAAFVGTGMAG